MVCSFILHMLVSIVFSLLFMGRLVIYNLMFA